MIPFKRIDTSQTDWMRFTLWDLEPDNDSFIRSYRIEVIVLNRILCPTGWKNLGKESATKIFEELVGWYAPYSAYRSIKGEICLLANTSPTNVTFGRKMRWNGDLFEDIFDG